MASSHALSRIKQLWQGPLLLISLGLFGYAAYLFIDPGPGLTIDRKIEIARVYLNQLRPEAAIEQLNKILATEKLEREREGSIHLMMAESLELAQNQKRIDVPANHMRIIEQTQIALGEGVRPNAEIHRRLGESYEALDHPGDALRNYRQAMAMDAAYGMRLQKKVIELQLAEGEYGPAEASLHEYLQKKELTDSERAWAAGEKAQILMDAGKFAEARVLLDEALRLDIEPAAQGQAYYRMGYCAWKQGDSAEAERLLRMARSLLTMRHPLDGDACFALGKIFEEKDDPAQAISFYQIILVSHPDSKILPLARLGRGICRIMQAEDDAGLTDLHELVNEIGQSASRGGFKDKALAGLKEAADLLTARENFQGALEAMAYEQSLQPDPPAELFGRLAGAYEKCAEQMEKTLPDAGAEAEKIRRGQKVRELHARAADAHLAYSRALMLLDDKGYGEALWRGVDLYNRAGDMQSVISTLELFVAERPADSLVPDALLRLGRASQAAGLLDKAIAAYRDNQLKHPQSLAASKSAVPLAQAYIDKGPESYGKAENVLLQIFENKPITSESEEFRQSLFELARLYYRTSRFEEAIARLEELTRRYPKDERMGELLFLMADSYRKSATQLDARLASADAIQAAGQAIDVNEDAATKRDRLGKARDMYDRVVELYRAMPPSSDADKLYQKLSHFYRADCLYELGGYEEAIRLYDTAAFRYQDDPSALAAYVQIVNAYCALGRIEEAKTANERAKWLLRRMPSESFEDGSFAMPKAYWEQWLKWTSDAGMW